MAVTFSFYIYKMKILQPSFSSKLMRHYVKRLHSQDEKMCKISRARRDYHQNEQSQKDAIKATLTNIMTLTCTHVEMVQQDNLSTLLQKKSEQSLMEILVTSSCRLLLLESEIGQMILNQGISQSHKLHEAVKISAPLPIKHEFHSFISSLIQGRSSNDFSSYQIQLRVFSSLEQWFLYIHHNIQRLSRICILITKCFEKDFLMVNTIQKN